MGRYQYFYQFQYRSKFPILIGFLIPIPTIIKIHYFQVSVFPSYSIDILSEPFCNGLVIRQVTVGIFKEPSLEPGIKICCLNKVFVFQVVLLKLAFKAFHAERVEANPPTQTIPFLLTF